MPKLYYTPTSCGAASFIAAQVAGVRLEAEQVTLNDHKTASGKDFYTINNKGNVPALVLDDGTVLNEGAAVLQWIADQAPGKVAPDYRTRDRYLVQQVLNYTASELHTAIGSLFNPAQTDATRPFFQKLIEKRLTHTDNHVVNGKKFAVGDSFTIADSYLYIVLSWTKFLNIDLTPYPNVKSYFEGIKSLDFIQKAHASMSTSPTHTA